MKAIACVAVGIVGLVLLVMVGFSIAPDLGTSISDVRNSVTYQPPTSVQVQTQLGLTNDEMVMVDLDAIWYSAEHASENHGDQLSWTIRSQCNADPLWTGTRSSDNRKATVCQYTQNGKTKFGVMIEEAWDDFVTAFPNKGRTLEKVVEYLARVGYTQ